MRAALGKP
jgi:hypothetical protein